MDFRVPVSLLAATLLAGCELLPPTEETTGLEEPEAITCDERIPTLQESDCLVEAWIDYALASQRGDREWRDDTLGRTERENSRYRLARAVALAWGTEREWALASELLSEDLHAAPSDLQPLLRYWLNEVEGRRAMAQRVVRVEAQRSQLMQENEELARKLEALTAIEQNINLRQHTP
ncbi:hypothetical protein [Litchfieldella xinjiangensis]|uniref:hypothetical protein n=1 Tax=Litchfieldella xinjiangensis TaxID=1166948 RepID=UPI0005BCD7FD|nr:hypothetical protein [Halomonas xinjiangensis]